MRGRSTIKTSGAHRSHPSRLVATAVLLLLAVLPAAAQTRTGVEKTILSNGLTLLVKKEPDARTAAIEVFIRVGAAQEDESTAGIGHLLAGSLLAGTQGRSPRKLAQLVSEVGGNFHAVWQWDYIEIYAVTLPELCGDAISLLSECVRSPSFDPDAIDRARSAVLRQTLASKDNQYSAAYSALVAQVHKGNRYGRPYLGSPDVIRGITRAQLEAFYRKHVIPSSIVISVAGNVDPMRISRTVEARFGGMDYTPQRPAAAQYSPGAYGDEPPAEQEETAASYVMIGWPAPGTASPDYAAACIANALLGGNKSARMFTKLREEQGIGYHVGSVHPMLKDAGHIAAYVGLASATPLPASGEGMVEGAPGSTPSPFEGEGRGEGDTPIATSPSKREGRGEGDADRVRQVRDSILAIAADLAAGRFTDEEMDLAKRYLIGSHALSHERTRDRAQYIGLYEALGLGWRYDLDYAAAIRSVTRADLERVCREVFTRSPSTVTVGR